MRKFYLLFGFVVLSVLMFCCAKDEGDKTKIVEMIIYPETGYGTNVMSDIWTQPLIFSDSDDNEKRLLIDIITEGFEFDYERGYEYKIKAKKIWMQEPPQDVSSIKYVFVELLSKERVITENNEENIELYVSPETVKFVPNYPTEYEDDETIKIYDALKVKEVDTEKWMALKEIDGFSYEEGYEYELYVKKVVEAEPYSVKYVLLDVLSKTEKN